MPLARAGEAMHAERTACAKRARPRRAARRVAGRACLRTMTSWDDCARSGVGCLPGLTTRPQKLLIVRVLRGGRRADVDGARLVHVTQSARSRPRAEYFVV